MQMPICECKSMHLICMLEFCFRLHVPRVMVEEDQIRDYCYSTPITVTRIHIRSALTKFTDQSSFLN